MLGEERRGKERERLRCIVVVVPQRFRFLVIFAWWGFLMAFFDDDAVGRRRVGGKPRVAHIYCL